MMLENNPTPEAALSLLRDHVLETMDALRAVTALVDHDEAADPPVGAIRWAAGKAYASMGDALDTLEGMADRLRAARKPEAA